MHQSASITLAKHKKFVERVVLFDTVWGLESIEGWATSSSNDDEEIQVIVFWSDKAYAKALAKKEWSEYIPNSMKLSAFLENWLVGMYNDGIFVGTNWDANMFGYESEPLHLAIEIIEELKSTEKQISFVKYKDLTDFESQIRAVIE